MKNLPQRILFLQLPRLENAMGGDEENLPMAGFYLSWALQQVGGHHAVETRLLSPEEEVLDDTHLLARLMLWNPDVVCATLYLWNIERTLYLLRSLKKALPKLRIICGGPEVAQRHPFLFKGRVADVVVAGEGEAILPRILRALEEAQDPDFAQVAWKTKKGYRWGREKVPDLPLGQALPPPDHPGWHPDANGMAYLETGRGCPMRCIYCRYSQMRRGTSFLGAEEVIRRVRILKQRGARQIRFVDPTFNANPAFGTILEGLEKLNRGREIGFFAEVRADSLSSPEIEGLAKAGFSEIEAGIQSRDPQVLHRIHRPARLDALEKNIRLLARAGIRVTIDLMYGLPGQSLGEVMDSLGWAWRLRRTDVQCLQTLLLPGTELREKRNRWAMMGDHRPPYGVRATNSLSQGDVLTIEEFMNDKYSSDCMTRRFVGHSLQDLFMERIKLPVKNLREIMNIPGEFSRRALIFTGTKLFSWKREILTTLRRAVKSEPHMLWQFVLHPDEEEPLDLLEEMVGELRKHAPHWIDRFACVSGWERLASRRVFVQLKRGRQYSQDWVKQAEVLLEDHFY